MRICLISLGVYPLTSGGPANVATNLAQELDRLGNQVIFFFEVDRRHRFDLAKLKTRLNLSAQCELFPLFTGDSFAWDFPRLAPYLIDRLASLKVDVVHFHLHLGVRDGTFLLPFILKMRRIPVIQTCHGLFGLEVWLKSMAGAREDLRLKSLSRKISRIPEFGMRSFIHRATRDLFDRTIVPSKSMAETLIKEGFSPNKIVVIPNGIRLALFDEASPISLEGKPSIIFVGYTSWLKGGDLLLRAFRNVLNRLPEAVLHVVGYHGGHFVDLSRNLGVEASTVVHEWVSPDLIPSYLKGADICIIPSRFESFGLTAIEAMAAGTPVVATEVGGLSEIVLNNFNGVLARPEAEDLARKVELLWEDSELFKRIQGNALRHAREFSWDGIVRRYLDVYLQLVLDGGTCNRIANRKMIVQKMA